MSLRNRLSRLGPSAPLSRTEREARVALRVPPSPESKTTSVEERSAPNPGFSSETGARSPTLDELRAKMNAILGRPAAPVSAARFDPSTTILPFAERETAGGRLAQRLSTRGRSERVGRIPLASAAESDSVLLSLLALDPSLSEVDFRKALYLDTETTGLGGAGTVAFLVGLGWFDEQGCFVLEQLLLRSPSEEKALLGRIEELIDQCSLLVSFNGKSFDLPLLQGRRVMNRLPEYPKRPHLDLLHVSRRIHKHRLSRCRLIDLESSVLGWDRGEDDIPGAEIAPRYGHFLRTGDEEALRAVVDHNAWDVQSMAALVALYGESLELLETADLVGVTRTLTRAKAYEHAERAADRAVEGGAELEGALEARARLFKARGDRARALLDFERLSEQIDDPAVRLELVKLYEHHEKDFVRALALLAQGTGESLEAVERRRARLEKRAASPKVRNSSRNTKSS